MQPKKVVVLGGGTGLSNIVKDLKNLPISLTAVVSVSDNGSSTGKLRREFLIPAVGDIRKVLTNLSTLPADTKDLMECRLVSKSELDGHAVGNLLLVCLIEKYKSLKKSIDILSKLLKVQHKVLPLSEDYLTLCGKTKSGQIVKGEEEITKANQEFENIFYNTKPNICPEAIKAIKNADLIVLSAGSLLTSLLPNIICKEVSDAIRLSKAKTMYVCNAFTEPGETDNFSVCDHVDYISKYLGKNTIDIIVANNACKFSKLIKKYSVEENKQLVKVDYDRIYKSGYTLIDCPLLTLDNGTLKHDSLKLSSIIFSILLQK